MSDRKSKRALRRQKSATKYARRLAINSKTQAEAVAHKPYQFKSQGRTCSCSLCSHNARRFHGNSLIGLSPQERRFADSALQQQPTQQHR